MFRGKMSTQFQLFHWELIHHLFVLVNFKVWTSSANETSFLIKIVVNVDFALRLDL